MLLQKSPYLIFFINQVISFFNSHLVQKRIQKPQSIRTIKNTAVSDFTNLFSKLQISMRPENELELNRAYGVITRVYCDATLCANNN